MSTHRCTNAHDRCYSGAGGPCPYCERLPIDDAEERQTIGQALYRARSENVRLREALEAVLSECAAVGSVAIGTFDRARAALSVDQER